jgi:hypothetical protein
MDAIYTAMIGKIGTMDPWKIDAVSKTYAQYYIYLDKLVLLARPDPSGSYLQVSNQFRSVVIAHCEHVIAKAEAALAKL